jgi:hypothetical protein
MMEQLRLLVYGVFMSGPTELRAPWDARPRNKYLVCTAQIERCKELSHYLSIGVRVVRVIVRR